MGKALASHGAFVLCSESKKVLDKHIPDDDIFHCIAAFVRSVESFLRAENDRHGR